jgi:NADH:ubiquinone reductase (non-electrogenic)
VTLPEFLELVRDMDAALRALPATAQVAGQEGAYVAALLAGGQLARAPAPAPGATPRVEVVHGTAPFRYVHKGQLAYLGAGRAALDLPFSGPLGVLRGWAVGELWRGLETWMQISARNRWMVASDWARSWWFGRNMSDV